VIERCFKCNGDGYILMPKFNEYMVMASSLTEYESQTCPRCLGSGAVNYEIVKAERLEIKRERYKEKGEE